MSSNNTGPDSGVVVTAIGTIATAVAAVVVAFRVGPNGRKGPAAVPSIDHTAQTLDSVFKLIDELQAENTRKTAQIISLEARIVELNGLIRELRQRRPRA